MTPQRFVPKEEKRGDAFVQFYKDKSDRWFLRFGGDYDAGGCLRLGNEKSNTCSWKQSQGFEGIVDTPSPGSRVVVPTIITASASLQSSSIS